MTPIRHPLSPDTRLLRPDRIFVPVLECLCRGLERAGVIRRFVARNSCPVHRFCRRVGPGELFDDVAELSLRIGKILLPELRVPESELQLTEEIVNWKKSLDPMLLLPVGIDDEHGGRPVDAE